MRSIIIYLLLLSPLPFIFLRPHLGILVWTWVSYMNPHKLTFGSAFNFPFLDILAPVTLAAWMFSSEPKRVPGHPLVWLLVGYFLYTTLTTYIGIRPELSFDKWLLFLKIILFTLVTIALITNKTRLMAFVWVIAISLGYFGIKGGLFTLKSGGVGIVWGPGGFIGDNNHLALALVMLIPLIRFLHLQATSKYIRWALLGSLLLVLTAVFGSQSRGAFLALSAMLIFFFFLSDRKAIAIGLIAVALVAGGLFMPKSWTDRMSTISTFEEDNSAMDRVEMWKYSAEIADEYPLGGGFDIFYSPDMRARYLGSAESGRASHSIYFEVLGEHGYPGLFFFFFIAATAFVTAGRIRKEAKAVPEMKWAGELASMCQISMLGYATAGTFLNLSTFDFYWHLIALIVIADLMLQQHRKLAGNRVQAGQTFRKETL